MRLVSSDNSYRSKPHRKVEKILEHMGLAYESEVEFPPYRCDIYMSEFLLGIEIDGPYGHAKQHDIDRDKNLFDRYGLVLLRLKVKDGLQPDKVENLILEFIDKHVDTVDARRLVRNAR